MKYKRYKSELEYTYALGAALVIELIRHRPDSVLSVFLNPNYIIRACAGARGAAEDAGAAEAAADTDIIKICKDRSIPCEVNQKIFNIAAQKENIYVIGICKKGSAPLSPHQPHAVFVNPADAGNLGANLRTCLGFGIRNAAIIKPGTDLYSPKTIRASMGAIFQLNTAEFPTYDDYSTAYPEHEKYCFMLDGDTELSKISVIDNERFALIFGNEATGLPDTFHRYGRSIRIPHSGAIDSLNVTVAVGIAAHAFYHLTHRGNTQGEGSLVL